MKDKAELLDRRCFVVAFAAVLAALTLTHPGSAAAQATNAPEAENWMSTLTDRKSLGAPVNLLRFADGVYVLTKPIAWSPDPGQPHKRVEVPAGFVTDFASTPRPFWSIVRPESEYAYAAIVHDYLYWTQDRPKEESDEIFKLVMKDLGIEATTIAAVNAAARFGGNEAWLSNARLKASGEKRVLNLNKFPSDPTTRWEDFKKRPTVFAE